MVLYTKIITVPILSYILILLFTFQRKLLSTYPIFQENNISFFFKYNFHGSNL